MSAASATAHSEYFLLKKEPFVFMMLTPTPAYLQVAGTASRSN